MTCWFPFFSLPATFSPVGDGGYPCMAIPVAIIDPYKEPLQGRVQGCFNHHHTKACSIIESGPLACWRRDGDHCSSRLWRSTTLLSPQSSQPVLFYITTAWQRETSFRSLRMSGTLVWFHHVHQGRGTKQTWPARLTALCSMCAPCRTMRTRLFVDIEDMKPGTQVTTLYVKPLVSKPFCLVNLIVNHNLAFSLNWATLLSFDYYSGKRSGAYVKSL